MLFYTGINMGITKIKIRGGGGGGGDGEGGGSILTYV